MLPRRPGARQCGKSTLARALASGEHPGAETLPFGASSVALPVSAIWRARVSHAVSARFATPPRTRVKSSIETGLVR